MSYTYPIDEVYWTKEEIIDVVNFYSMVEQAYENGVDRDELMLAYTRFKQIVPSKSEEKTLCGQFEKESGYSCYQAVKQAKSLTKGDKVKM
ncbi:Uncharacterized protein YktA, UPF0223 family [Halobacillus karajensis]|uniref:Uncharacterized protein n=1 Tax=Halobacillus karajensis TaxID=195088 RepID=A0A024P2S2_9BACI|nr:UPF0223 family protein [Halobacillus karajensis]CDQ19893.1 hypothetical protein BN982_02200 [Halobacillus karajensis]CDQ22353.1 hypothetical protein BN983_00561 [Halobacillus karajensis]CDQ28194.1 hypothetical protein BN981_02488 [Halobacillus karajensis]SEH70371.1 Uncharacterized protein YktA, UPF0223 family [Halobacillus karajensis]